jgi:diguanylate cyclase (GGDEF)-like protein
VIELLLARMVRALGGTDSANGRSLAGVWGFGATCLTATILLPHPDSANDAGLIAVVLIAYPVAALMFIHAARLPRGALEAITYLGQLLITTLSLFWGAPDPPFLWFHLWLVVHSFHFLPPARALMQIACASALFVTATVVTDSPFPAAAVVVGVGSIVTVGLLVGALRLRVDELLRALARSASTDPLTGLANRRAYADAYARERAQRARSGAGGALLVLDVDHFKLVNDRHGSHAAGDRALQRVAEIMQANIREVDTAARLGGDEFSILLAAAEPGAAADVAERIRRAVACDGTCDVTLSIGVVELPAGMTVDLAAAIAAADRAMYRSKQRGGDCVSQAALAQAAGAAPPAEGVNERPLRPAHH